MWAGGSSSARSPGIEQEDFTPELICGTLREHFQSGPFLQEAAGNALGHSARSGWEMLEFLPGSSSAVKTSLLYLSSH